LKDDSFRDFVLDQLGGLGPVSCRAMFGGHGLSLGDRFFGIIHKGRLYFKTGARTVGEYLKWGARPFCPNRKQTLKTYYEVPGEILDDPDGLVTWARRALEARPTTRAATRPTAAPRRRRARR
jgi:DNA transformation protein